MGKLLYNLKTVTSIYSLLLNTTQITLSVLFTINFKYNLLLNINLCLVTRILNLILVCSLIGHIHHTEHTDQTNKVRNSYYLLTLLRVQNEPTFSTRCGVLNKWPRCTVLKRIVCLPDGHSEIFSKVSLLYYTNGYSMCVRKLYSIKRSYILSCAFIIRIYIKHIQISVQK